MKTLQMAVLSLLSIVVFSGCTYGPTRVHVQNLNAEKVSITITPETGPKQITTINDVNPGETSPYTEISPTNGGTISGSRNGTNPKDIRFYALDGNTYIITLSAGDTPTLSWKKE
jgi:hypothetical protein